MRQQFQITTKLKIVIDSAIPFVQGVFEPYSKTLYLDGKSFLQSDIADADALVVRTRTRCNKSLLKGSRVRHIATATIGFDHIDLEWCTDHQIEVSTAAGCNARAVLQWIGAVLVELSKRGGWQPSQRTLGVVGVGNVGSLVAQYAKEWGFDVVCCDPPRQASEGGDFISFEELLSKADIVTFHTPLNSSTRAMLNAQTLSLTPKDTIIINSSRGEVVDTLSLLKRGNPFVMDVWEDEPNISTEALERAIIATPHIAGYSLQGKANASTIAVRNVASSLGLPLTEWSAGAELVAPRPISWEELNETIAAHFDIIELSRNFKSNSRLFEELRNNYNYRSEYF